MAVTSMRQVFLTYAGDINSQTLLPALANFSAPSQPLQVVNLVLGANTITVPTAGVAAPVVDCCTIVPPAGNTVVLTLKGVSGDTGITIHPTDPTALAIASTVTTFVINAASAVSGLLLYWS